MASRLYGVLWYCTCFPIILIVDKTVNNAHFGMIIVKLSESHEKVVVISYMKTVLWRRTTHI